MKSLKDAKTVHGDGTVTYTKSVAAAVVADALSTYRQPDPIRVSRESRSDDGTELGKYAKWAFRYYDVAW